MFSAGEIGWWSSLIQMSDYHLNVWYDKRLLFHPYTEHYIAVLFWMNKAGGMLVLQTFI